MKIDLYNISKMALWDDFVHRSKNGSFLFFRNYMDYHSNRFADHSLLFYDDRDKLTAVLPASLHGDTLKSHGGLTFGGLVTDHRMTTPKMLNMLDELRGYALSSGISKIIYKAVPHIYHRLPAEEDLYALFRMGARTIKREVSSTIDMTARIGFSKGRKYSLSKARKANIEVREVRDFGTFMKIEEDLLREKYDTEPVHTTEEMSMLASRFPKNIRLFSAFLEGEMCAGVIMYVGDRVAHAQYMASSPAGRENGALDMVINVLVNEVFTEIPYFDFGISTEEGGRYLNQGLIAQKEMFGARAIVYETFELELSEREDFHGIT